MSKEFMKINSLLVDTNILLEFFELILEPSPRGSAKRDQLVRYIYLFRGKKIYIVPQILAELYSLLNRDAKNKKVDLEYWLIELIPYFKLLIEEYIHKDEILSYDNFQSFGFSDIALIKLLEKNRMMILITMDFRLIRFCRNKGFNAYHPEEIFT